MFQLGVCPRFGVLNPNNHYFSKTIGVLSANTSLGATEVNIDTVTVNIPLWFGIRGGDYLIIGPSTNSKNKGVYERKVVSTVVSATINIEGSFDFLYDKGDLISVIGTNAPKDWSTTSSEADLVMKGMYDEGEGVFQAGPFEIENYALRFELQNTQASLYQYVGNVVIPNTYYCAGFAYKTTSNSGYHHTLHVKEGEIVLADPGDIPANDNWSLVHAPPAEDIYGNPVKSSASPDALKLYIGVYDGDNSAVEIHMGYFYVCHAKNTDDAASGIYTFDNYPQLGSLNIVRENRVQTSQLWDQTKYDFDPTGQSVKRARYGISCSYRKVSNAFLKQLKIIEAWQNRGNFLVFKHNDSDLQAEGVPPVLIGRMELGVQEKKDMWDLGRTSFEFKFMEQV